MSFDDLRAFLEVVRRGSFFAAAEALRTSRTTLRRQVDALEARAGVPLLARSRNGVVPTEAGRRLMESGTRLTQEFAASLASVREAGKVPAGDLSLALPVGLNPAALVVLASLIAERWPKLRFHPRLYETLPEAERMDSEVLVTLGGAPPDGAWVTRTVGTVRRHLLASSEYLAAHGTPERVEDLSRHVLLSWIASGEKGTQWPTSRGPLRVQPRTISSDAHLLHLMAHAGHGIALVPDAGFPPAPGFEPLVPVLPDLVADVLELRVSAHESTAALPRVKALMDCVTEFLGVVGAAQLQAPAA